MALRPSTARILTISAAIILTAFAQPRRLDLVSESGAEWLYLDALIERFSLDHSFDMISQKGRLYLKRHSASYAVGFSVMVVDGRLFKSRHPVKRRAGRILVPLEAGERIITSFYPGVRLERHGDSLHARPPEGGERERGDEELAASRARDRMRFIVVDPGHGGRDPGAVGRGGLREKSITLSVARILEPKLRARLPGIRVVMTRKDDRFIELAGRTAAANRLLKKGENGMFVSIHVNSSLSPRISGHETFFLSQNPTNEDARNTAALENNVIMLEQGRGGRKGYDDVDYIEAVMITTQIQKESALLADSIQRSLARSNRTFSSRGVKKADFFVLRGVLMPAALVEIGYISNRREAGYLTRKDHQEAIAEGIAGGIEIFIREYNRIIKAR